MRYFTTRVFDSSLIRLPEARKKRVKKTLAMATVFFETGSLLKGLGLKPIGHGLWEIRAGLQDRVLFLKKTDVIEYLLVGSHDDVRRHLKAQ